MVAEGRPYQEEHYEGLPVHPDPDMEFVITGPDPEVDGAFLMEERPVQQPDAINNQGQ